MTTIVWLRQDLRTADNPALYEAAKFGPVLPLYILENGPLALNIPTRAIGAASRWWLHASLANLESELGQLVLKMGDPLEIIFDIVSQSEASAVFWNRRYEPGAVSRDKHIKSVLTAKGVVVKSFSASLLAEPWEIKTKAGEPFKVYSPFWRTLRQTPMRKPLSRPKLKLAKHDVPSDQLRDWGLQPTKPNWAVGWNKLWQPGESGASKRLRTFLKSNLHNYSELRNRPDLEYVSRLSPHLHFGEISPHQVWAQTLLHAHNNERDSKDAEKFLSELAWRDFSYHLLFHNPTLPTKNWKPQFDRYPWRKNKRDVSAWQRGMTGYPLIDAGMRELWQTGYMHNRVRMVAASFLVKHLRIHWHEGETWFWDTLVDADLANNSASWQWVTGSGADAAPYFRIFNPTTQAQKFDPNGHYIRKWCPELSNLDNKLIHAPFDATTADLAMAGIVLGKDYPKPIADHTTARKQALDGYSKVKNSLNDRAP